MITETYKNKHCEQPLYIVGRRYLCATQELSEFKRQLLINGGVFFNPSSITLPFQPNFISDVLNYNETSTVGAKKLSAPNKKNLLSFFRFVLQLEFPDPRITLGHEVYIRANFSFPGALVVANFLCKIGLRADGKFLYCTASLNFTFLPNIFAKRE
jgi:hypothetical protein